MVKEGFLEDVDGWPIRIVSKHIYILQSYPRAFDCMEIVLDFLSIALHFHGKFFFTISILQTSRQPLSVSLMEND